MTYFFDTSALVKWFHAESGTEAVEKILNDSSNAVWLSELAVPEFHSALLRRFRMKQITQAQLDVAVDVFGRSISRFRLEPVGGRVTREATRLLLKHGTTAALKTLDSLHIATFLTIADPAWVLVSADRIFVQIASAEGFQTVGVSV